MDIEIGLSKENREALRDCLLKLLCDVYSTYLRTQKFHWNIEGKEFYSLHLLLEKQYEDLEEAIDEIAERVRSLGYPVKASFTYFKENTSIPEEKEANTASDMLQLLINSHEIVIRNARKVATFADEVADHGTVDMLGRRIGVHEKFAWMLRSSL